MNAPMERMLRADLIRTIRADRARFEAILATVPADALAEPVLDGGWSVKDVLAHIAWGDREAIGVIRARALVGSPLWDLPQDERNDAVARESRARDLDDVIREFHDAFAEYVAAIGELTDEELNAPDRFAHLSDRIPGWRPWRVLYDPAHYDDHGRQISAACGSGAGDPGALHAR